MKSVAYTFNYATLQSGFHAYTALPSYFSKIKSVNMNGSHPDLFLEEENMGFSFREDIKRLVLFQ